MGALRLLAGRTGAASIPRDLGCSWPDELVACLPSPPSDSSAAPSLVASSDDDEDWGSPPSSPRVTPALVARLSAWIASSSQLPTT